MRKSISRVLITRLLPVFFMCTALTAIWGEFAGGKGTEQEPWKIATAEHLNNVRNYLGPEHKDKHFIQVKDIDLDVRPYDEGDGWEPIGTTIARTGYRHNRAQDHNIQGEIIPRIYYPSTNSFHGTYDGRNNSILNLRIAGEKDFQGLFGHTVSAKLLNIVLDDVFLTGSSYVGSLLGLADSLSTIKNCSVLNGSVKGDEWSVGGLIGYLLNSIVSGCYSGANITGSNSVGGLIGRVEGGTVVECYSSGSVYGRTMSGGLIGITYGFRSSGYITLVERSFSSGFAISCESNRTSAFIGSVWHTDIKDCYSSGTAAFYGTLSGGFIGSISHSSVINCYAVVDEVFHKRNRGLFAGVQNATIENIFWYAETNRKQESAHGAAKTRTEMVKKVTYQNWDFEDIWRIEEGYSYPYLSWQQTPWKHNIPGPDSLQVKSGNGVVELRWKQPLSENVKGYNIYRDHQLLNKDNLISSLSYEDRKIENFNTYFYHVTAVLHDNTETRRSNTRAGNPHYMAAGSGTEDDPYIIVNAHQLNAIKHNLSKHFRLESNIDLGVSPWNVDEGWKPIGDVTAFTGFFDGNGKTINNLTIERTGSNRGLFGYVRNAEIINLGLVNISVLSGFRSGGLAVSITDSIISGCYVSGSIQGSEVLGGIAGHAEGSLIRNCYNTSDIAARAWSGTIGGIVGTIQRSTIENCYSIGQLTVRSPQRQEGGLVGRIILPHRQDSHIINSYWNIETSGHKLSAGGGTGLDTVKMSEQETYQGWDFDNIWTIGYDGSKTYPWLRHQGKPSDHNYP